MKEIIITSQHELDQLSKNFNEFTSIIIRGGTPYNRIVIKEAWENSSVEAWGNSFVKIYSKYCNIKKAMMESVIIYIGVEGEPKLKETTASILHKNIATWTHEKFCQLYDKQIKGNFITLYNPL